MVTQDKKRTSCLKLVLAFCAIFIIVPEYSIEYNSGSIIDVLIIDIEIIIMADIKKDELQYDGFLFFFIVHFLLHDAADQSVVVWPYYGMHGYYFKRPHCCFSNHHHNYQYKK